MKPKSKMVLWACVIVIVAVALGVGAIYLIDTNTGRGRWAAAVEFVLPAIAGLGALVVAAASWQTARRATKIAADVAESEQSRLREDRHERYEWRLDEALVEIAKLLAAHRLLLARIQEADAAGQSTATLRAQRRDRAFDLGSEIGIVGILARGEDSEVIELLNEALRKAASHPDDQHMRLVMAIAAVLQAWRSQHPKNSAEATTTLRSIASGAVMAD